MNNQHAFRLTKQRSVILRVLAKFNTHPTADEIYDEVRAIIPRISLGTVYRNLEFLCAHGLIKKLEYTGYIRRYDGRTEDHYHIRCLDCGKVEDFGAELEIPLDEYPKGYRNYKITGHQIEFMGICPECRKRKK